MEAEFPSVAGWLGKLISYNFSFPIDEEGNVAGWLGKLISYNASNVIYF